MKNEKENGKKHISIIKDKVNLKVQKMAAAKSKKILSSQPIETKPTTSLKRNFWVTFFKLAIPSILLLSIIFALVSSWRAGTVINTNKTAAVPSILGDNVEVWKNLSMWFAVVSIFITIACFAVNKNTMAVYSLMAICGIMIIIVLTFAFMCIFKTTALLETMPGKDMWPPPAPK